jgi:hypothetical protein
MSQAPALYLRQSRPLIRPEILSALPAQMSALRELLPSVCSCSFSGDHTRARSNDRFSAEPNDWRNAMSFALTSQNFRDDDLSISHTISWSDAGSRGKE